MDHLLLAVLCLLIQRRVALDFLIEQQIPVKMPERRKLPAHTPAVDLIRKQPLQEFANIVALRRDQKPFLSFQKLSKLKDVSRVSADRKRRQPFLDAKVVEKARQNARVRPGRHRDRDVV